MLNIRLSALLIFTLLLSNMTHLHAGNKANPDDVNSIDAIINAVYDVISGPKGQQRDWDRFHSLFAEGARLIPYSTDSSTGTNALTPEEYIERSNPFLVGNGFFESEIGRRVDRYGNIAQVFSAYQSKHNSNDPEPFARGINSIQLVRHAERWWVVTIFWQNESESNPVPEQYLQ